MFINYYAARLNHIATVYVTYTYFAYLSTLWLYIFPLLSQNCSLTKKTRKSSCRNSTAINIVF